MKYLIALFLLVSPGFACEHRSSFLHKTPDFKLLFWGLSSQGTLVEIYQNLGVPVKFRLKLYPKTPDSTILDICLIGELISMLMNVSACLIILNFCLAR